MDRSGKTALRRRIDNIKGVQKYSVRLYFQCIKDVCLFFDK